MLLVVRAPDGVRLNLDPHEAHIASQAPLTVFFVLLSPDGHSARHYRLLAHLVEHFEDALDNPDTSEREALDEVARRLMSASDK